jgi:HD-like signal output (HDOD) protein
MDMSSTATLTKTEGAPSGAPQKVSLSSILDNPRLPSPPAVVLQIVDKASRPDCNADEILALLGQDSGLCCQVLKTVNSGLYGLSKPVGSLKQAVALLGMRPLRSLVLSLALPAIRTPDKDDLILKYWQESVAGAVIARELARFARRKESEDDLVAGLLRDLGMLVLREAFPGDYRGLWARCSQKWAQRQCDEERETFGVDHAEISAGLLHGWNLPPEIYMPIRFHHDPESFTDAARPDLERAWVLCFASKVAMLDGKSPKMVSELLKIAEARFAMNQASLIKFLGTVMPAIQEFAALLKVDMGTMPNYAGIIATGCQELIRLTVESSRTPPPTPLPAGSKLRASNIDDLAGERTRINKGMRDTNPGQAPAAGTLLDFDIGWLNKVPEGGFHLHGYEIKQILGRGGMGVVFKAYDPQLARFAAVKMMTPQHLVSADSRVRFQREARAAAGMQHENVVTIYAVSEVNGLPYLVMEYLPGTTLHDRVEKEGALPLEDVISYGRQIAAGLHAAHQRRIIHRDIKPANILLSQDKSSIKITDFGLARALDETRQSQDGMMIGTPLFMAPEQFSGVSVDHRADLFSLGSVLYTLCAGKTPFRGESVLVLMKQVSTATPVPLRSVRPDASAWLVNVINKLLAKLPASRYQTAAEVVQAFAKQAG